MSKILARAFEVARELPAEMQDELGGILLRLMGEETDEDVYELTPEEEADLDEALAEVERGELATDEEVRAVLAKYRL